MSEWQPIETAPQDGGQILACRAQSRPGKYDAYVVRWNEYHKGWMVRSGASYGFAFDLTHWVPLPEPPK